MVHPYFDFHPSSSTTLKIIIDIASAGKSAVNAEENAFKAPEEIQKGCVTVFVQDKTAEEIGF